MKIIIWHKITIFNSFTDEFAPVYLSQYTNYMYANSITQLHFVCIKWDAVLHNHEGSLSETHGPTTNLKMTKFVKKKSKIFLYSF